MTQPLTQTETDTKSEAALPALMSQLLTIIDSDDDYGARDVFKQVFVLHEYNVQGDRTVGTISAGSSSLKSTPHALYRLLFLSRPTHVDFSDMYKSESLFALVSPDGHFVADIQMFKYELAIYFSASTDHIEGRARGLQAGAPGSDNGIRAKSPEFKTWCKLLVRCLNRKWMVYGGNEFEV